MDLARMCEKLMPSSEHFSVAVALIKLLFKVTDLLIKEALLRNHQSQTRSTNHQLVVCFHQTVSQCPWCPRGLVVRQDRNHYVLGSYRIVRELVLEVAAVVVDYNKESCIVEQRKLAKSLATFQSANLTTQLSSLQWSVSRSYQYSFDVFTESLLQPQVRIYIDSFDPFL